MSVCGNMGRSYAPYASYIVHYCDDAEIISPRHKSPDIFEWLYFGPRCSVPLMAVVWPLVGPYLPLEAVESKELSCHSASLKGPGAKYGFFSAMGRGTCDPRRQGLRPSSDCLMQ